jgi:hypothetical protein
VAASMEQLVITINNEKETSIYATAPGVDAVGLDQVDYLTVRLKGGKLRKITRDEVTQWWEKDMEDGSLLILEDGSTPLFRKEPDEGLKNIFVDMQRASQGRIQPLREFECSPTVEDIEDSQDAQTVDPDKIIDLVNFDKEMGEIDDFKHSSDYSRDLYICWTNKKDYEAAMPKAKKDENGKEYIHTNDIDLTNTMTLTPDDFFYLNEKNKIYAYIHKSTEICVEDHSIGYY